MGPHGHISQKGELQQGGRSPQDAVSRFLGAAGGSRSGKEAFYERLAQTADTDLPSQSLAVTVSTFEAGKGAPTHHPIGPLVPCLPCLDWQPRPCALMMLLGVKSGVPQARLRSSGWS